MNGEIPSVPITTLAGIASLSDLLPELPLPTPVPETIHNNSSLLYHPQLADRARRLLATPDESLVSQLVNALSQTNTDNIQLKDGFANDEIEGEIPELLRAVLNQNPNVFKGGRMQDNWAMQQHHHQQQQQYPYPGQPMNHYGNHGAYHPQQPPPAGFPMSQASPYASQPSFQQHSPYHGQQSPYHSGQSPYQPGGQHSPYAAGHMSPYPPTSPARYPQQTHSPAVHGQAGFVNQPNSSFPGHQQQNKFQQQFSNFASPQGYPAAAAVNGGSQGQYQLNRAQQGRKSSTVSSPAQANAAPLSEDPLQLVDHRQDGDSHVSSLDEIEPSFHLEMPPATTDTSHGVEARSSTGDTRKKKSKTKKPVVMIEPLDESVLPQSLPATPADHDQSNTFEGIQLMTPQLKLTKLDLKGRTSTKASGYDSSKRGTKRHREDSEWDPSAEFNAYGEFAASLTERVKRRRSRQVNYNEDDDEDEAPPTREFTMTETLTEYRPESPSNVPKKKKKEKIRRPVIDTNLSTDELMETATFKRFNSYIDTILDQAEEVDLTNIDLEDDDAACPPESLIGRNLLSDLCSEAAKLKTMGVMNEIPYERLVKLLTILQWNVRDGARVLMLPTENDDEGEEESRLWKELTMERVNRSVDAALTALHVMTSPNMPKQVYIEDVIDRLVFLTKYQLINTIYPEFDPVYKETPKGQYMSVRMKRAHAKHVKHKSTLSLYNKLTEIIGSLSELVDVQELTDTVILQMSSLGVTPFFVENISELQLNAMKLVTTTFSKYEKHRQLILEDIFSSLARLPSSKRNLRSYRMDSDQNIQMVTALALQLIQCVIKLPVVENDRPASPVEDPAEVQKATDVDKEVVIVTSYETAMRTGHNFLSVFLKKCAIKGEEDYRPLFENFVQDLLATVNKPEWPAAELLLSLLGRLLVQQFSNKSVEMSMRVASLDYLGIVAARLRKDAISSQLNQDVIEEIIERVTEDDKDSNSGRKTPQGKRKKKRTTRPLDSEKDQTHILQKAMLDYLAYNSQNDPALDFARKFYIAQWYRDSTVTAEKASNQQHNTSRDSKDDAGSDKEAEESETEKTTRVLQQVERSKHFLMSQVPTNLGAFASYRPSLCKLDYDSSCLVARYLASNRPFSQSFDIYLTQILKVLCETAVAVRTKAMKCLTAVVEADPGILARKDMRSGVHGRFLDHSTAVREAAVELVGKFILVQPQLTEQYYDMLSERILDTGISVRKRVIKIFRDICLDQPDFQKIPEMCVKMIRRVNDEEGIKKLVNDVFQNMWFTPVRDRDTHKLLTKVMNITDVVTASKDTGFDFLEQLLSDLFKKESESQAQAVAKACRQIVDCLVENVLRLEEKSATSGSGGTSSARLVACLSTLYLFTKIKPELLVPHAQTLQPYLNIAYKTQNDNIVLHHVASILELVVPLMANPGESFLLQLETDMMKLILRHGQMVLQACVSCLGASVNQVSHNYKLVRDCFQKFFGAVCKIMSEHKTDFKNPALHASKPTLLRALFTVGLLCKHFDFDAKEMGETKVCVSDRVFDVLMYFVDHEDENVKAKSLTGLGFLCSRKYEYMLGNKMKSLYHSLLTETNSSVKLKCQVLQNLKHYLTDEEVKMFKADAEWKKTAKKEDLKEMCDVQSGMASTIMQLYLKHVLESFFHSQSQVRSTALSVIQLVLQQGLVHPVQCVPYLVAIETDCEPLIRNKSEQQLKEIDKKYPGFIHMKAMQGVKFSYRLQQLIQQDLYEPVRGIRDESNPQSLNAFLYTIVRSNRQHRRGLLLSLLNLFDDSSKTSLAELVYIADNLAFFPYLAMDEPLFIMHQIDIILSVSGPNLIQSFREAYTGEKLGESTALADIEDEDFNNVLDCLPDDTSVLQRIMLTSQGCVLLLKVKQHLKEMFGFTDSKLHQYSPTEAAKVWEKPLSRKTEPKFHPKEALECLRSGSPPETLDTKARVELLQCYFDFKELILSIDPAESSEDESTGRVTPIVIRTKLAPPTHDATDEESANEAPDGAADTDESEEEEEQPGPSNTAAEPQVPLRELKIVIPLAKVKEAKEKRSHSTSRKEKKKKSKKKKKKYISSSEEDEESFDDSDDDFAL